MPVRPLVPDELLHGPFTLAEAERFSVSRQMLRGRSWVPVTHGVYAHRSLALDDDLRLAAVRLAIPADAVATDLLAAWAHGVWTPPPGKPLPLHWATAKGHGRPRESLDDSRRLVLGSGDVVSSRGMLCTSTYRTAFQLMRRAGLVEAVVIADAFAAAGKLWLPEFYAYVDSHRRWPGVEEVRRCLTHASQYALSPGETRLRMVAVLGGLPVPYVNVPYFHNDVLLGYPDLLLVGRRMAAAEYDGAYHESVHQRHADLRRENRLVLSGGLPVLRYDRHSLARAPLRERALREMGRAIDVEPLGALRPEWFRDPRRPLRW